MAAKPKGHNLFVVLLLAFIAQLASVLVIAIPFAGVFLGVITVFLNPGVSGYVVGRLRPDKKAYWALIPHAIFTGIWAIFVKVAFDDVQRTIPDLQLNAVLIWVLLYLGYLLYLVSIGSLLVWRGVVLGRGSSTKN